LLSEQACRKGESRKSKVNKIDGFVLRWRVFHCEMRIADWKNRVTTSILRVENEGERVRFVVASKYERLCFVAALFSYITSLLAWLFVFTHSSE